MTAKIVLILLTLSYHSLAAEISSSYALLEKHSGFNPDLRTEPVETHPVFKKDVKEEPVAHPVFKPEEHRARIELVKAEGNIVKHEMLADQPSKQQQTAEVNRIDNLAIPNYGFVPAPVEATYPDVPYAPGYGYEQVYSSNNYDPYSNGLTTYFLEPDTSAFSLLWSQVPDARAIVGFVGRTIAWFINSLFVLFLGSLMTVGLCSYTNICTIAFHGVGPIHEEMRALVTPERLEKISTAADFVKNAIDKYQKIQKASGNKAR